MGAHVRYARGVGLCLVAVFVLGVAAVATASAELPEYQACLKVKKIAGKYKGRYSLNTCAAEASEAEQAEGKHNAFEREELGKAKGSLKFQGRSLTQPRYLIVDPTCPTGRFSAEADRCESAEAALASEPADIVGGFRCEETTRLAGEITGAKTDTWKISYKHCEAHDEEFACNTARQKSSVIVTDELEGTLVFLNPERTVTGVRIRGRGGEDGTRLLQFECGAGAESFEVFGEVMGRASGNVDAAREAPRTLTEEGPLRLQSDPYEGAESFQTEEDAKAFFIWDEARRNCVAAKLGEGDSQAEAESLCEAELGAPPAARPVMLEVTGSLGTWPVVDGDPTWEEKFDKQILIAA